MNYIKFGEYSERSPGYRLPKRATKSPEGFSPFFIYTKKWYQCRAVDQNGNKCTVQVRAKRYDNLSDLEKARNTHTSPHYERSSNVGSCVFNTTTTTTTSGGTHASNILP